jgi:hypothetical protein
MSPNPSFKQTHKKIKVTLAETKSEILLLKKSPVSLLLVITNHKLWILNQLPLVLPQHHKKGEPSLTKFKLPKRTFPPSREAKLTFSTIQISEPVLLISSVDHQEDHLMKIKEHQVQWLTLQTRLRCWTNNLIFPVPKQFPRTNSCKSTILKTQVQGLMIRK